MADARDDPEIFWVEPKTRAILPLDAVHISKSLAKHIRRDRFTVTTDTAFPAVIASCAEPATDRDETWINGEIERAFLALHSHGRAHSIECWQDGILVGGLYGLALGRVFFGESMFSRATDASKIALVWLVARLRMGGFQLLDCQFLTEHLASLGVVEITQKQYLKKLSLALKPDLDIDQVSVSSAGAACGAVGSDWGALDGFLASGLAPSSGPFLGTISSSPGKLILHSLTQTS